jgi:hypothetical protein
VVLPDQRQGFGRANGLPGQRAGAVPAVTPSLSLERVAAAVEHGRADIGHRVGPVGELPPVPVQAEERVLDDVLGGGAVTEHDHRDPDHGDRVRVVERAHPGGGVIVGRLSMAARRLGVWVHYVHEGETTPGGGGCSGWSENFCGVVWRRLCRSGSRARNGSRTGDAPVVACVGQSSAQTARQTVPRRSTRPVHALCSLSPACGGRHASGPARAARQKT